MRELEQYKYAIENSNIVSKTDINGIITFVNDEFCRISGYTKDELVGQNHNIVRHPDVPKATFKKLWSAILNKRTFKTTAKNLTKDKKVFYVNTTISPLLDEDGNIREFIAIRYDATESVLLTHTLKKKEEELVQLNATLEDRVKMQTAELLRLNKNLKYRVHEEVEKNREKDRMMFQQARLAAMGEMIANIAHQWRQPLSELSITLYNMKKIFLGKNNDDVNEQYEYAKKVIRQMSSTIDDFRDFFKPEKEQEKFSLQEIFQDMSSILGITLKRSNISLTILMQEDLFIFGYKNEFLQVILNIINNAKDALNEKNNTDKKIEIKVSHKKCLVEITIKDNAKGLDINIIDKIFEPYFTTKHASIGTGLGLYMCKTIIENSMNGEIFASSKKDETCFSIKIPTNIHAQ